MGAGYKYEPIFVFKKKNKEVYNIYGCVTYFIKVNRGKFISKKKLYIIGEFY